ncbi:hypothetical protein [Streptomyces sp. NPDC002491]
MHGVNDDGGAGRGGTMAPNRAARTDDCEGQLTHNGTTWIVESEPVVVDTDDDGAELVEVWVRRGEDIGESS